MTISALLSRRFDEHRKLSASRIPARLKILLAKVGFDGHDRGIKILTSILREHGHEVVYLGKYLTVAVVVEAALQEDVDVIGLSFLGGSHITYCQEIAQRLRERGLGRVCLVVGGVIPDKDIDPLKQAGVHAVFTPNTDTRDILKFLDNFAAQSAAAAAQIT
jgi:methylmalonyl-CoA mutase C-terminal domain/subunit